MSEKKDLFGGVEAGGTKIICCIGYGDGEILDRKTIKTTSPEENMPEILSWFHQYEPKAFGLGWFGPICLQKDSKQYGTVLNSPKLLWRNRNVRNDFLNEFSVPTAITTDVNSSLLGEVAFGAGAGCSDVLYLTVGTGVGAGILSNGQLLQGVTHPEAGHILLNRLPNDPYPCACEQHTACLEGLVSGRSIEKRFSVCARDIPDHSFAFELTAEYLAMAIYNYILILTPQKIILGGGVMEREFLFNKIREEVIRLNNGYLDFSQFGPIDQYIVPAKIGGDQALMGCLRLASFQ